MNELNTNGLRGILDDLPTLQLQQMLDNELQKEKSDPAAVKLLLSVLEVRHAAELKPGSAVSEEARKKYQDQMEELFPRPPRKRWIPLLRVASVLLIVGILFAVVPQQAEAENFWEMLQRLTSSVLELFSREDVILDKEYTFKTYNEGLQQVYDAVIELGVTEPVVPMWLPDGCELAGIDKKSTPMLNSISALFLNDASELVYKLDMYEGEPAHQFYRDGTYYDRYERNGMTYTITRNNDYWIVVWAKDNIECLLTLDCQEDTLRRILKSIYVTEE